MSTQLNKKLFEQLQFQMAAANKTAKQLGKALGFDESVTPKKETLQMKAQRNVAEQFANINRKIKQSANK